ncbi:MAG: thioesterase domain-containing protein [Hyphomicrobium aestuarii]|nr:thioesterase domain-containing protein [Hyphomicrobium aestuarii]
MLRSLVIWVHTRLVALAFAGTAALAALAGLHDTASTYTLLASGTRVPATVIEMVESSTSAETTVAQPAAQQSAAVPPVVITPAPTVVTVDPTPSAVTAPAKDKPDAAEAKPPCRPTAPKVRFDPGDGKPRELVSGSYRCPRAFKLDQRVEVAFDPKNPDVFVIASGSFWSHAFGPVLFVGMGLIAALGAWFVWPSQMSLQKLLADPAVDDALDVDEDDHLAISLFPGAVTPGRNPLNGIVASAAKIEDGKYPLDLCEFTAYMSALAYHEPLGPNSKQPDPKQPRETLITYLERTCGTHISNVATFSNKGTEGFGFVTDDAAFIVMRGTVDWLDWQRNLKATPTGLNQFTPREPGWQNPAKPVGWSAPQRHLGFAEGFDVIRDQIEAWVAQLPRGKDHPFVFTGHSLGGALSFLAAWEFATRGRTVAAVITFGAAIPGWSRLKSEYEDELGLGKRTLRLEFTQDIVPVAQTLVGYTAVGRTWEPRRLPLTSQKLALAAVPFNWALSALQASLSLGKKNDSKTDAAAKPRAPAPPSPPGSLRRWALRFVIFVAFSGVLALAAHQMQRRYAVALSVMSYRRIRARRIATEIAAGRTGMTPADFEASYQELHRHLQALRGAPPSDDAMFKGIRNLPRRVEGVDDLRWLNSFHGARMW